MTEWSLGERHAEVSILFEYNCKLELKLIAIHSVGKEEKEKIIPKD